MSAEDGQMSAIKAVVPGSFLDIDSIEPTQQANSSRLPDSSQPQLTDSPPSPQRNSATNMKFTVAVFTALAATSLAAPTTNVVEPRATKGIIIPGHSNAPADIDDPVTYNIAYDTFVDLLEVPDYAEGWRELLAGPEERSLEKRASCGTICTSIRLVLALCGRIPTGPTLIACNAAAGALSTPAGKLACKAVCEQIQGDDE